MFGKIWVIICTFCVVMLSGCESMPQGEMAYQTLHAVDTLQTINGPADDPCYTESDPITRRIIGREPSRSDVIVWGVGKSIAHYTVSKYLENNAPDWTLTAWQLVSTGNVALTVYDNHEVGVRPWGENDHSGCGTS